MDTMPVGDQHTYQYMGKKLVLGFFSMWLCKSTSRIDHQDGSENAFRIECVQVGQPLADLFLPGILSSKRSDDRQRVERQTLLNSTQHIGDSTENTGIQEKEKRRGGCFRFEMGFNQTLSHILRERLICLTFCLSMKKRRISHTQVWG